MSESGIREGPEALEDVQPFAEGANDFALALYRLLRESGARPRNVFVSPFGIRMALAVAHAGARGETAAQMRAALRVTGGDERLHAAYQGILQRFDAPGGADELQVANALWLLDGPPLEATYRALVARYYRGRVNLTDARDGSENARAAINRWVAATTRQRIREVIPPGALGPLTSMVLLNAVYFKGRWAVPFPKRCTTDEPFYVEGGGEVRAPLMHVHEKVRYARGDGFQAVDIAYRGDDLSMLVVLPDRRDGLRELEARLSPPMLRECLAAMQTQGVKLFLPRFRLEWGGDLADALRALGMPLAFTPRQADFSGVNGAAAPQDDALNISAVLHRAFVDVDEEGTEAAAATAVTVFIGASGPSRRPPVPVVRADHPFVFAIRDRKTSAFLFLGRMADPSRTS